jgi:hypothetical protein
MAGRAALHAADLPFEEKGGQGAQLSPDLVGELGDRVRPLSFFRALH